MTKVEISNAPQFIYAGLPAPLATRILGKMPQSNLRIDHIGIASRDIHANQNAFEALGFFVTELKPLLGRDDDGNSISLGQWSQHCVFPQSYLELTAVPDPNTGNHLEPYLSRFEGCHILALGSNDAQDALKSCEAAGVFAGELRTSAREITYGVGGDALFKWFEVGTADAPGGFTCVVEHVTPELVFDDAVFHHPNGATGLIDVTLCAEDLSGVGERYAKLFGIAPVPSEWGLEFDLGQNCMGVADRSGFERRYPNAELRGEPSFAAFTISVANLKITKTVLAENDVTFYPGANGTIWGAPASAGGAVIEFREV
jgi:hypothetical protein